MSWFSHVMSCHPELVQPTCNAILQYETFSHVRQTPKAKQTKVRVWPSAHQSHMLHHHLGIKNNHFTSIIHHSHAAHQSYLLHHHMGKLQTSMHAANMTSQSISLEEISPISWGVFGLLLTLGIGIEKCNWKANSFHNRKPWQHESAVWRGFLCNWQTVTGI